MYLAANYLGDRTFWIFWMCPYLSICIQKSQEV